MATHRLARVALPVLTCRVPSPCFVIDEVKLRENLSLIADISQASNARILMALKAFSMWSLAPVIGDYLHGCCASGL